MVRDRLAELRPQQPSVNNDTGVDVLAEQDGRYEMSEVGNGNVNVNGDDMSAFYAEIRSIQDSLRTLNDNVSRISDLHSRSLSSMDEAATRRTATQIDGLAEETALLSDQLKVRIKNLQKKSGSGQDHQIRQQQTGLLRQKFVEAIQNYQQVEQQYRAKYMQRVERQFKIVKPDATPEEIKAVVNDDQGAEVFAQALQSSNRYGESRAAYKEVQERHEDIKRIERTLGELARLFNDMSVLVEQQDETINTIQTTAIDIEKNTETGLQHTNKAVDHARAARRKRWICFLIILVILAIIGIALGIHFGTK